MANTLYDLLEINQSASPEAIAAGYRRLHQRFAEPAGAGDEDATNRLIALREAYTTLSDPVRRQRYDARLAAREVEDTEAPPTAFVKWLLIAAVLGASGVGYAKYRAEQAQARLESERAIAASKAAELEAQKDYEEKLAASRAEQQRRRDLAADQASRERDIAYSNQVSRNLQHAETQARWERQREEQHQATLERQQQYEAERQLAREKAYLRKIEAENARYPRY